VASSAEDLAPRDLADVARFAATSVDAARAALPIARAAVSRSWTGFEEGLFTTGEMVEVTCALADAELRSGDPAHAIELLEALCDRSGNEALAVSVVASWAMRADQAEVALPVIRRRVEGLRAEGGQSGSPDVKSALHAAVDLELAWGDRARARALVDVCSRRAADEAREVGRDLGPLLARACAGHPSWRDAAPDSAPEAPPVDEARLARACEEWQSKGRAGAARRMLQAATSLARRGEIGRARDLLRDVVARIENGDPPWRDVGALDDDKLFVGAWLALGDRVDLDAALDSLRQRDAAGLAVDEQVAARVAFALACAGRHDDAHAVVDAALPRIGFRRPGPPTRAGVVAFAPALLTLCDDDERAPTAAAILRAFEEADAGLARLSAPLDAPPPA
jgi:hypothetical protein